MTQQHIGIILDILLIVIGLYLAFFKSYLKEKGKNLATVEDIGKITKIVESVKQDNNTQLELIKTELALVSKTQLVIYDDERKAIIEFIGAITGFYESNINIPIEFPTPEGFAYRQERIRVLENFYGKVQIARSRLLLFCFDGKILEAISPVLRALAEIKGQTQVFRFKILGIQMAVKHKEENYIQFPQLSNIEAELDDLLLKYNKIYDEFCDFNMKFLKDYIVKYNNLLFICRDYLRTKKATNLYYN